MPECGCVSISIFSSEGASFDEVRVRSGPKGCRRASGSFVQEAATLPFLATQSPNHFGCCAEGCGGEGGRCRRVPVVVSGSGTQ